jgi:hypothetical protein
VGLGGGFRRRLVVINLSRLSFPRDGRRDEGTAKLPGVGEKRRITRHLKLGGLVGKIELGLGPENPTPITIRNLDFIYLVITVLQYCE